MRSLLILRISIARLQQSQLALDYFEITRAPLASELSDLANHAQDTL
jgi:hypothetical protein